MSNDKLCELELAGNELLLFFYELVLAHVSKKGQII